MHSPSGCEVGAAVGGVVVIDFVVDGICAVVAVAVTNSQHRPTLYIAKGKSFPSVC